MNLQFFNHYFGTFKLQVHKATDEMLLTLLL